MMEENPYAGILEVVRTDADARSASPWVIGTVAATAPLTVMLGGIPLSGADLLVNPQLLPHEETAALSELKGSLEGSPAVSVTNGSLGGKSLLGGVLVPGDRVAMLASADGQQYVVICKVVSA